MLEWLRPETDFHMLPRDVFRLLLPAVRATSFAVWCTIVQYTTEKASNTPAIGAPDLARAAGVSRDALWSSLEELQRVCVLRVHNVPARGGRGHANRYEPLWSDEIARSLSEIHLTGRKAGRLAPETSREPGRFSAETGRKTGPVTGRKAGRQPAGFPALLEPQTGRKAGRQPETRRSGEQQTDRGRAVEGAAPPETSWEETARRAACVRGPAHEEEWTAEHESALERARRLGAADKQAKPLISGAAADRAHAALDAVVQRQNIRDTGAACISALRQGWKPKEPRAARMAAPEPDPAAAVQAADTERATAAREAYARLSHTARRQVDHSTALRAMDLELWELHPGLRPGLMDAARLAVLQEAVEEEAEAATA